MVEDFLNGRGEDACDVRRVKFKLANKRTVLVDIEKHMGLRLWVGRSFPGRTEAFCKSLSTMVIWMTVKRVKVRFNPIFRPVNQSRKRYRVLKGFAGSGGSGKGKPLIVQNGKLAWIWIEEARELEEGDIDIMDERLRGILTNPNLYYQITFTFNPVIADHWVKRKFFECV